MNSIRDEIIALDTNEFIFAVRRDADHPACEALLFDRLGELKVYLPLQVLIELQRNLTEAEMSDVLLALAKTQTVKWDYTPAPLERVSKWEERGAKKGDAVIAAHLEAANVRHFISENRHFLVDLANLPFEVLTSEDALRRLSG